MYFGDSLGDNLLITTICRELYERGYKNIWIKCNHTELFKYNPHIKLVLPYGTLLSMPLMNLFKVKIAHPVYTQYDAETDRDIIPEKHIVLKMADYVNLKGQIKNKPVFNLDAAEEAKGKLLSKQIAIVSSTIAARYPMRNKEWLLERYQQVIDNLSIKYNFVQVGDINDAKLENVLDMRGKTTIRETAAILKNSLLLVSHVGFIMHLARAVDCHAVIVYGGREKPAQSGYGCFQNIYSDIFCSPCWLHNLCPYERRCMTLISSEMVNEAIHTQLANSELLQVDILYND